MMSRDGHGIDSGSGTSNFFSPPSEDQELFHQVLKFDIMG